MGGRGRVVGRFPPYIFDLADLQSRKSTISCAFAVGKAGIRRYITASEPGFSST